MGCCFSNNKVSDVNQPINNKESYQAKTVAKSKTQTDEIEKWVSLIEKFLNKNELNNYVKSKKRREFKRLDQLTEFLSKSPIQNNLDLAWAIFLWITENIEYDGEAFRTGNYGRNDAESVLLSGKGVCSGYTDLYEKLCNNCGIECKSINGYAKGFGYNIGQKFNDTNHAWNAIKIEDKWYYVESTWGSGTIDHNFKFNRKLNPYYFCTPPEIFVETHYSPDFQLHQNISLEQFEEAVKNDLKFYAYGFRHVKKFNNPLIESFHNPYCMELICFKDCELCVQLVDLNTNIGETLSTQKDSTVFPHKHCIIIDIKEKNVTYNLKIFGKECDSKQENFDHLATYMIIKKKDDINKNIPNYNISFLNNDIRLLSHGSQLINYDENPLKLELSGAEKFSIIGSVKDEKDKKIDGSVLVQKSVDKSKFIINILCPNQGRFKLELFYNKGNQNNYDYLTEFILMKNKPNKSDDIKRFINLFNFEAFVESPLEYYLVTNKKYEFKIRLKNVLEMALVDKDNKWHYFEKLNNDLFVLEKQISSKGVANVFAKFNPNENFNAVCNYEFI